MAKRKEVKINELEFTVRTISILKCLDILTEEDLCKSRKLLKLLKVGTIVRDSTEFLRDSPLKYTQRACDEIEEWFNSNHPELEN